MVCSLACTSVHSVSMTAAAATGLCRLTGFQSIVIVAATAVGTAAETALAAAIAVDISPAS